MAEYLVTLSLLIIIVLLVRGFFRRSISPTVMYALWLVVVLRLCLPFPLFRVEMDLPAWQETIPQEQQGQQGAADPGIDPDTVTPPVADTPSVPDTPPVISPTTPSNPSHPSVPTVPSVPENPTVPGENPVPDIPDVPVTPEVPVTPPAPIDWMGVAVTVWIAGSAILALWFAITGIVYHYRLITHRTLYKTLRKTKVYLTEDESAPCLAGVIPAIYIPPVEMDEDFRAFIVLHEYMHLRHGDHVWAVVRILALIAHWWNPLVWAAVILSKRDAELACDHAVAAQLNRENRLEYAHVLLDTIPQKHRYAVGLGSAPMKERILRLTKTQKNRILCVVLAVIIAAAAVVCSFIGLKDREEEQGVGYDNVGDLIELLNTTAAELTDRYGEMTLEYMENGGTPVYSFADLSGILFVFPVSDTLPTDGQIPDEILLTSEYSKDVYGIQVGMNLTEVPDDISWDDAWFSLNQGAAGVRKDYPNCILTLTVACQAGTTPNEENSSAEWETWREEFIKNPAGVVTQIRIKLPPAADPAISARAEKLTAHLIQYVMIEDWLEKSYTITAQDVFAFFDSLRWYTYKDLSEYPYGDKVETVTVGEHLYARLPLIEAERIAYEVFGWNDWNVDVFPNDDYDASKKTYLFRLEPGLWNAHFTCESMTVSVQGDQVYVRCILAEYGQYEFHYRYTEENGGYLTLINGEYLSAPDIPLPDNFAEFYHEAERVYSLFTGHCGNIYAEGKFSDDGADYQAVDIDGCTTMAGLRALCEQYFDAALTDELLSTTVMNQYPLYREHNGKLYRFSGYVAQFGYDIGKSYRMSSVKTENGAQTVRVSAVWYEGERQISTEVSCAYTTLENEEIRFTSFSLMAQALSNAWANYSDYMLLTQSDYNGISLYYRADDPDESMAENFFIRFGGREAYISTTTSAWLRYTWEPQLYCIDMELPGMQKDGIEDAVVIFTTGTGTGVHTEEAYVLSGADGALHSFTEPYTVIENAASRDDNGKTWIVDASGKQIGFPDNVYFDKHFKFYIEDGCLGAKVSIGYGMLQYLESYFRVKYGESGVSWEYVYGDTAPATVSLHDYKNKKLVNSLVYEGYTVEYELPHPTYEGQTFDFHIHLPQIDDDSPSAEKWNTDIVNAYDAKYSTYLSGSASGTNRNFYAEIRYETVTTGDVVTIYILNSCGVLNSGDARRSYDIYHYDTKGKRFLTTNEFLAYYAKGQFASSSVADIVAFMNEHAFTTDEVGTPIPLKEENIQGVIPSVFGDGKFDVVYQGYSMEGKFATRMLFSPYPTYGNPHRYTYRLTYHDYTDCHTAEMNGQPAGYRLLICQRSAGKFDVSWYIDRLFLEDIAEPPESYPLGEYGGYYTPVNQDAYGNMFIVVDHKTDAGQLQAWIPFDQPSTAQDYYRGVLLGYFNYDRLFGGNAAVEKSVGSMIASVLDAYRNGKDPNELLPASETKFTPYPVKSVRANPGDEEIRAILDAATVDESGIIRLRVDLGEGYILELPMELGIFGESYQAYFTGIYFIKPQKVTTQGPFIGYVADKTTPWIDLYTGKNGTYVGRIPYEIFHDWIATDRDKDTWTPGWMGEYVCFYYAEFGDFRWAAAHLRDTVLGSGRKNVATSADGGKTWDIGSTRDDYGGNHVVGMGFATDKIAFISYDPYNEHDGADGPVISRTTDGGKTWKLLDVPVPDSLKGKKLISGIPFYDGDLLRYPVWLNPSHGTKEGEVMYLISRDKGLTWEWEDAGMTEYVVDIPLQDEKREFITCAAAYGTSHGNVPPHSNVIQPGQDGEIYYVMGVGDSYRSGGYFRTFKTYRVTSKGGYLVSVEETETFTKDVVLKNGKPYSGELDGMFTSLACRRSQQGNFNYELRSHSIYLQKDGTIDVSSTQVGTGPPVKYEGTYQYDGNTGTFAAKLTGSYSYEGNVTVYPETEVTGKLYEYGGFVHFICESSGVYALTVNDPLPLTFVPNTDGYANPSPVVLDDVYNGEWYYDFSDERGNQFYCLTIDTESAKMQFDYGFYESEYVNRYIGSYTVNPLSDVKTAVLRDSNAKHSDPEITLKFYLGYSKTNTGTTILLEVLSCDVPKYQHLVGKMISLQKKSVNADTQGGTESLSGVLSCILRGEDAFYDTAAKQRVFLTDWLKTNEMSVSKYSVIDLNGDGASELVLWLNRGTNEYVGFLVLYDKNTTVYAHLLYYRQFSNLKKDGTFGFSGGVSNHGIGRIDFEGDKYTIRSLAYCESADNQNVSYFVDGKSVSKAAFEAYETAQNNKTDAVWIDCLIEPAPGYKQYTPAIEIDTDKLDYIKPMAMYGESRPGANFDRTANIYPGTGFEGYADGVGYITFGICNDRKSPDYVSRYYTYRVTSAGGYIISVEETETITRDIVLKKGKPYTGSLEGQHTCVVNNRYYGITISGDTISASVGLYQTDAGGTGKGTYTYDPATGKMTITTIEKYHDGNGNLLVNSPKTVTGKLYEYNDMVHFLYDDAKATPLPLSFPKINAFPPDRTDFIFDDLAGEWYHSFRDAAGDQFYCLTLDPETQQIRFDHGFYDGSYAARYVGTYRVDYNYIIHATLRDNNDPDGGEMQFVFILEYSHGRDETGVMRTTISITPQSCDMENYRDMLGRRFGFQREKFTTEELDEREEHYNFVMTAYETASEAASWFRTASLVEAGEADGKDSIEYDGRRYYRVTKFDTYAELRQYLEEWFSASLVDQLLSDQSVASYISHNGKLYATPGMVPQNIRLGERYYSASKVKDDWYSLTVTVEVLDIKDLTTVLAYQSFQFDYQYKNGKWVFIGFPHIQ